MLPERNASISTTQFGNAGAAQRYGVTFLNRYYSRWVGLLFQFCLDKWLSEHLKSSSTMAVAAYNSSDFAFAYKNAETAILEHFQSVKQLQNCMDSLERNGNDLYSRQDTFNGDLNRRIGQLGSDLRNNQTFEKEQRQRQLDQLATLERDRVAWIGELDRLEQAVKEIDEEREERIVELRDVSDKSKKLLEELEGKLKQSREQIAMKRTGIMAISVGLLLVGVYVRKGF